MTRFSMWISGLSVVAIALMLWLRPVVMDADLQQRKQLRKEARREIAAQPFVRAKMDSGFKLVTGSRCAPFDAHAERGVEFCLEKKSKSGEVLQYTFERYLYDSRDSGACSIRPMTENGWECLP